METQLIYKKILAVMQSLKSIPKQSTAPTGTAATDDDFDYRGIDAIYNALNPLFKTHGIFCLPEVINSETAPTRDAKKVKTTVEVRYTFCAEDGSKAVIVVRGEAIDDSDKGLSKAMSIAQKTALTQMFLIPTNDPKETTKAANNGTVVQDQRVWLNEGQFKKILTRLRDKKEAGLLAKVIKTYRMKDEHINKLQEAMVPQTATTA